MWDDFSKLDWNSEGENYKFFKKLNEDIRGLLLGHMRRKISVFGKLKDKEEAKEFYRFTVKKMIWCSWRMMLPWISTNIFASLRSTCPALDIIQNWFPLFDAGLEEEELEDSIEMIHEALFLISNWNLISATKLTDLNFSKYFSSITKFWRLVALINLGNCLATQDKNLERKICGCVLQMFKKILKSTNLENLSIWKNPKQFLKMQEKFGIPNIVKAISFQCKKFFHPKPWTF
jgi:hypothetical protein